MSWRVPHDESTMFDISGEYDSDWDLTCEGASSDRVEAEHTDERVMSMHTEICEKSGVFSVEERQGVESDMVQGTRCQLR